MQRAPVILLAAAAAVIFLGAGCRRTEPAPATSPDGVPTSLFAAPETESHPNDTTAPGPLAPPLPEDAAAPTPPPGAPLFIAPDTDAPPSADTNDAPTSREPTTATFSMVAKRWEFEPSELRVRVGTHVILDISSTDTAHGIALPAFGINERVEAGETIRVEFTADRTGTFSFVCSVYCGSGHSHMTGTLIVE